MENTEEAWPSRQRQDRYIDGLREVGAACTGPAQIQPRRGLRTEWGIRHDVSSLANKLSSSDYLKLVFSNRVSQTIDNRAPTPSNRWPTENKFSGIFGDFFLSHSDLCGHYLPHCSFANISSFPILCICLFSVCSSTSLALFPVLVFLWVCSFCSFLICLYICLFTCLDFS